MCEGLCVATSVCGLLRLCVCSFDRLSVWVCLRSCLIISLCATLCACLPVCLVVCLYVCVCLL